MDQVREIAQTKMEDLNANDIDQAAKIIAGTARSMGITVERLTGSPRSTTSPSHNPNTWEGAEARRPSAPLRRNR